MLITLVLLSGCGPGDPCAVGDGAGATSACLAPTQTDSYYEEQGLLYFDSLESGVSSDVHPDYADGVARWEWPPWLKLTGYGREDLMAADAIVRLIPTSVPERDCRAFPVQPFTRCWVSFAYEDHPGLGCPIYEEFTFNAAGQMTFIEAWSDDPALLPMADSADTWGEGESVHRMSTKLPGLGSAEGTLELDSPWMTEAAESDPEIADFVTRARDFYGTWLDELESRGDDVYAEGCGWPAP